MKEIADAYREIWKRKLVGQKPPDQHSIDRVTWTDGLLPQAVPSDVLVDLGTGSGAMLGRGRAKGYLVIGTDIDKELVDWLCSTGFPAQVEDLNVMVPFPNDHFAVVTSCDVIEHLWNPNQSLRTAATWPTTRRPTYPTRSSARGSASTASTSSSTTP